MRRDAQARHSEEGALENAILDLLQDAKIPAFRRAEVQKVVQQHLGSERYMGQRVRNLRGWKEYLTLHVPTEDALTPGSIRTKATRGPRRTRRAKRPLDTRNPAFSAMRSQDSVGQYALPPLAFRDPPRLASDRVGEVHFSASMGGGSGGGSYVNNAFDSGFVSRTCMPPANTGLNGAVLL